MNESLQRLEQRLADERTSAKREAGKAAFFTAGSIISMACVYIVRNEPVTGETFRTVCAAGEAVVSGCAGRIAVIAGFRALGHYLETASLSGVISQAQLANETVPQDI